MQASPSFWRGRTVCVTGGAGFLGFHLVEQLRLLGARVRVYGLKPNADHPLWGYKDVDLRIGDIRDLPQVRQALVGCSMIFHTAGLVAAWGPAIQVMNEVHVVGTDNVLASATSARVIHTSSVVAVGASRDQAVLDEESPFSLRDIRLDYVHAKRAAEEHAVQRAAHQDIVIVNPAYLVGPEDYERSAMGRFCTRVWKGRVPLAPTGGLNFVDVRDVATGHLLAAEKGQSGRRYILAGEDVTQRDFIRLLAQVAGHHHRWLPTMPHWALWITALLAEQYAKLSRKEPYPSLGTAELSKYHWYYRSDRAVKELGYQARSLEQSLRETYAWYAQRHDMTVRGIQAWWVRPETPKAA